jgi:hypothetical protein
VKQFAFKCLRVRRDRRTTRKAATIAIQARLWRQSLWRIVSATRSRKFCGGEIVAMPTLSCLVIG